MNDCPNCEYHKQRAARWRAEAYKLGGHDVIEPTGTEMLVCEDIAKRQQVGIKKYGTTVCANPLELREWLQHAYEECLDQAVYLRRAIQEIDKEKGE
jgi:hypothetical protein